MAMTDEQRLIHALNRFEGRAIFECNSTTKINPDMYYGEPCPSALFLQTLDIAYKALRATQRRSFLDVGCGVGSKCLLAADDITEAHGIEFNPEYVNACRELGVKVWEGDAREYKLYHRHDVVFMHNPMRGEEEPKLELYVWQHMAPWGLLITINGKMDTPKDAHVMYEEGLAKIYSRVIIQG